MSISCFLVPQNLPQMLYFCGRFDQIPPYPITRLFSLMVASDVEVVVGMLEGYYRIIEIFQSRVIQDSE
jgi:hypothetical protein